MKKNTKFVLALTLLALISMGFGCKGLSQEQQAAVKPITLNYWTIFDDVNTLKQMADAYRQIRPYVTINIRQVRYEEFDNLFVNALADDVAPDIASIHVRSLKKYLTRLSPMPASVKVSKIEVKGQYSPETIITTEINTMPTVTDLEKRYITTIKDDVKMSDGKIYGLPLAADTLAIYYNKEILDKAGIAEPPKTWEEFKDDVKKITKFNKDGKIVQSAVALGGAGNIDNAPDILALLMMQNGVDVTKDSYVSFADGLNSENTEHPALEVLQFYTSFSRPTKDLYSWNEKMGNALEEFAAGKVAFYFGFAYDRARIVARGPQLPYDVVSVPQLSTPINVANYWVESVVKKSKKQNEAWDFIRFMSQPENIQKYTKATRQPSPLRSQVTEQSKDVALAPFASQILTAKNWYRGRDVDAANGALRSLIRQAQEPLVDPAKEAGRDAQAIIFAASVMQQTM